MWASASMTLKPFSIAGLLCGSLWGHCTGWGRVRQGGEGSRVRRDGSIRFDSFRVARFLRLLHAWVVAVRSCVVEGPTRPRPGGSFRGPAAPMPPLGGGQPQGLPLRPRSMWVWVDMGVGYGGGGGRGKGRMARGGVLRLLRTGLTGAVDARGAGPSGCAVPSPAAVRRPLPEERRDGGVLRGHPATGPG